jgi:hypothetical protein
VSQFAAGCAICGENLVAARRKLEERNAARERFGTSIAVSIVVLLLISFVPGTWDELLPWVDLSGPLTD